MLTLALVALLGAGPAPVSEGEARAWHRAVGLLQYLEGDYAAAVASGDAAELEEQRAFALEAVEAIVALGEPGAPFVQRARAIAADVVLAYAEPAQVAQACGALARELVQAAGLQRAPRHPPDLAHGKRVWEAHCQSCHGVNGGGDTEAARALKPPPRSFHDPEVMDTLTPYKAFNTTTFGVKGTAMAPFPALSDDDRWAAAFYLFTLRQPPCEGAPRASLEALATRTDGQLEQELGAGAAACLRRKLPAADQGEGLVRARAGVGAALAQWRAHRPNAARQALIDAYLEGVEPVEPLLRARDPEAVRQLEAAFGKARTAAQDGVGFEAAAGALLGRLDEAGRAGGARGTFWSVFLTAALILLREGFEAMVVVAALLAILKKLGARAHARTVHLGWASALVTGAALYLFGQSFFAGARRELLETAVAFAAVAMLLYSALWLNARAAVSRHLGALRGKMQAALSRQSAWGLFAISFAAVLRETAETALFLQGLAGDSPPATAWGALTGLALLGGLVALVARAGFRLPMRALFTASTALLLGTAVVLCGKGVHGLQELGLLGLMPLPSPDLPAAGLFADAWPTLAQALLLAGIAGFALWKRARPLSPAVASDG